MVRLLIVDDEEEIRTGIRDLIDWETNGIQVCGEASSGMEALKCVDETEPDIMLVDIRMPIMSGLEVIESLSSGKQHIKTIILSGFDDFLYAQKALKLGTFDYLLKPCRPEEILDTVLKAKALIEAERKKKEVLSRYKLQLSESLPILKEKFLTRLVKGEYKYIGNIKTKFEFFKMGIHPGNIKVGIVRIDDYFSMLNRFSNEDMELMKFAVKNITGELIGSRFNCDVFESNDDIIAIINIDEEQKSSFQSILDEIRQKIKSFLGFAVSIGVGNYYSSIDDLQHSYDEALEALEIRFFSGEDCVIHYEDISCFEEMKNSFPLIEERDILNCIKFGNEKNLHLQFEAFFSEISSKSNSKEHFLKSGMALLFSIYHLCIEKGIDTDEFWGQYSPFDEIAKLDTVGKLKAKLWDIVKFAYDKFNNKKNSNKLIELATKFIKQNYYKDIGLDTVAHEIYITPGYVSLLFKQSLGTNFVDYLHKTRIEKACEILKDIRLKTYEVSTSVGYNDEKYFTQIFKKYTGMTPTQYRDTLTF